MAVGPFQGYSAFDSLMRKSISDQQKSRAFGDRASGLYSKETVSGVTGSQESTTSTGVNSGDASVSMGGSGSATQDLGAGLGQAGIYENQAGGMDSLGGGGARPTGGNYSEFASANPGSYGMVGGKPEDISQSYNFDYDPITNAQAAANTTVDTFGPYEQLGRGAKLAEAVTSYVNPAPFVGDLISGTTTVDPYQRKAAIPTGLLGVAAKRNIEEQYTIARKIQEGTPGYHQFYSGGQLVSIAPNVVGGINLGYAPFGTTDLNTNQAVAQYSTMFGYDPSTVDLSKRPGDVGFGTDLKGFVPGVGGIGVDGTFVDTLGERTTAPPDRDAYLGMVTDLYGPEVAAEQAVAMGLSQQDVDAVTSGSVGLKEYRNASGETVGYGTGTGGIVTSGRDGSIVTDNTGRPVTSGTGYISTEQYEAISNPYSGRASFDVDEDDDNSGTSGDQASADEEGGSAGSTPFAEGGTANNVPASAGEAPVETQAGFVGEEPEAVPDGETVADDVSVDVPEGTFVLNAPSVEFMGSADVKTMILDAMAEAEKQGIDVSQKNESISKENLVSLVVSKGEVLIPPELAEVIGYDRLNKINNRGKQEVEKRLEENAQAEPQQAEPPQADPGIIKAAVGGIAMAEGGNAKVPVDLDEIVGYEEWKNPWASTSDFLEVIGSKITGSTDAMEKAYSYSRNWNRDNKAGNDYEDTFRHTLLGGLYNPVAGFYADGKEGYYKDVEAPLKIKYEKAKKSLGIETDPEQIEIAKAIITESEVDLNNNRFGRQLRKMIPDEKEYVRAVERMINIATTDGFESLPPIQDDDGNELRLQRSTVPAENLPPPQPLRTDEELKAEALNLLRPQPQMRDQAALNSVPPTQNKADGGQVFKEEEAPNAVDPEYVVAQDPSRNEWSNVGAAVSIAPDSSGGFLEGTYSDVNSDGAGFAVSPGVSYNQQSNSQQFPDGVVQNNEGKNVGFAMRGEFFLNDDTSLRAGISRQVDSNKGRVVFPEGEEILFGGGSTMKRYDMGATFKGLDLDFSKTQNPNGNDLVDGQVTYQFDKNGRVSLSGNNEGDINVGLEYRF